MQMKRVIAVLLPLSLCGCISQQKRELATCELEAIKSFPGEKWDQQFRQANFILSCMQENGYELDLTNRKCRPPGPEVHVWLRRELHCYRPDNWFGKIGYEIEAKFSD